MAPEDEFCQMSMNPQYARRNVGFSTTRGGTQKYCEWV
jgi:hypothetical protein